MADVLVVDDDENLRDVLRRILERAGHTVRLATDGVEAVQLLEKNRPDVVLTDIYMPGLDGVELTRILQKQENPPAVIGMSGKPKPMALDMVTLQGASATLNKPFMPQELLDTIERVLVKD